MEKNDKRRILVIIPAYNEELVIEETISKIISEGYSLVIIDDGSNDNTYIKIRKFPCYVLRHFINLGQGAAIQTGFQLGLQHTDCDVFVTFDADGQHRVGDIELIAEPIIEHRAEVVLGSRFAGIEPENMPRSRRLFLQIATFFTRIINKIPVTDTHNGLRAFSRKAIGEIEITHNGMSHASEILAIIHRKNLTFTEVPVQVVYSPYSLAKGQNLLNSINILWDLFFEEKRK